MAAKKSDSEDSSDDDYYDNFEKYKQKHNKVTIKAPSTSNETGDSVKPKSRKPMNPLGKDPIYVVKLVEHENKKKQNKSAKAASGVSEIDKELAELFDSPPALTTKPPAVVKRNDDKLGNILMATKNILENAQRNQNTIDSEWIPEPIINSPSVVILDDSLVYEKRCTIFLRNSRDCHTALVRCDMHEPFHKIMTNSAAQIKIEADKMILMGKDCRYYPEQTPAGVGFDEDKVHEIDVLEDVTAAGESIAIKWLLKGKKPITANVLLRQSFADIKESICREQKLDLKKTQLVFDSDGLKDDDTPESIGMEEGDCIDVYTS